MGVEEDLQREADFAGGLVLERLEDRDELVPLQDIFLPLWIVPMNPFGSIELLEQFPKEHSDSPEGLHDSRLDLDDRLMAVLINGLVSLDDLVEVRVECSTPDFGGSSMQHGWAQGKDVRVEEEIGRRKLLDDEVILTLPQIPWVLRDEVVKVAQREALRISVAIPVDQLVSSSLREGHPVER